MKLRPDEDKLAKIRILAFDLDGTLLATREEISPLTLNAIRTARDRGYHILVATGRGLSAMPEGVLALDFIEYLIYSNGAGIYERSSGETIYSNYIGWEALAPAMPWISDPEVMREAFFGKEIYADDYCLADLASFGIRREGWQEYVLATRKPHCNMIELIKENADILENLNLIFADPEKRIRYMEELAANTKLSVVSSTPVNVELGGETTSKSSGIAYLADLMGLSMENVMSFGDSTNDLAMIEDAGIGVAMDNAVEEVKEAADWITASNDEDGIALALKELLNIRQIV